MKSKSIISAKCRQGRSHGGENLAAQGRRVGSLWSLSALLVALAATAGSVCGVTFYVSPAGKDSWSGKLPEPNKGKTDGPLATVQGARNVVRTLKTAGEAKSRVEVQLRGGNYFMTEPLVLEAQDSGGPAVPIVYLAAPGEKPVLCGAVRFGGWKAAGDGIWTTQVSEVKAGRWFFRQLFVNGQRRYRPRLPKTGLFPVAGSGSKPESSVICRPGDFDPRWTNRDDLEFVFNQYWMASRLPLAGVDEEKRMLTFKSAGWRPLTWSKGYFVDNVRAGFIEPGQWYLDRAKGLLSYRPLPGEDMTKVEVMAPVTRQLLRLDHLQHVTFRGLIFAYTAEPLPADGFSYPQADVPFPAAIEARYCRDCRFEQNELAGCGQWGIELGRGCQDNAIVGNYLHDVGGGGIKVGETDNPGNDYDAAERNLITDNVLADGDQVYLGAPAVWIGHSGGNRVAHNEIRGAWQWAASVGWDWDYLPPNRARDNLVEDNHIHDLGRSELGCHAAIYCLGLSPGTVLRRNHIHDVAGGGYGICLDSGCSGVLVEDNLIHHCDGGFLSNYHCIGNIVLNNIFALNREVAINRYGDPPPTGQTLSCVYTFCRNVVYLAEGRLMERDDWGDFQLVHDLNLFFDRRGTVRFMKYSFEDWKAKGMDRASVIADPLFVDPDHGDFNLKADSPALKLGFRPLDLRRVGPRREQR
ncbi:MAG: right-handed parallel beta-helix repeat-containing protein [Verrucomicrobia bacterium]|nr:right-handed parallel beta-helix repeat-containing protein [Verrucomicrobiota bacterium]